MCKKETVRKARRTSQDSTPVRPCEDNAALQGFSEQNGIVIRNHGLINLTAPSPRFRIGTMFHFQQFETFLKRSNKILERSMPILTPTGVVIGLLLGSRISWMKPAVTWLFAFITMSGAFGINPRDFFRVISHPKPLIAFFIGSHVCMPLLAWAIASLIFRADPAVVTGFVLLFSIPTAVVGYIWSSIYHGDGALSLTLILLDTILAPFVTPFTVKFLTQTAVQIDTTGMMLSLVWMVVIPSIIGILVNYFTKGRVNDHVSPCLKPFGKVALLMVVAINVSQIADEILKFDLTYIPIVLLCLLLACGGFLLGKLTARFCRLNKEQAVSVTFAIGLRNISAALVLAISFFPPHSALPVIFGIVFQQTVCALTGQKLFGEKRSTTELKNETRQDGLKGPSPVPEKQ